MRIAQPLTLTPEQRATLVRWSRGRSTPARLVLRAKIVLLAADGLMNKDIALELASAQHGWALAQPFCPTRSGRHREGRAARGTQAHQAPQAGAQDREENHHREAV